MDLYYLTAGRWCAGGRNAEALHLLICSIVETLQERKN